MPNRILAIGDVHGCHTALTTLLNSVDLASSDTLVFLGDLVDRGPASRQVLDCVIELKKHHKVVSILGNHDEMMQCVLAGRGPMDLWKQAGGDSTLASFDNSLENVTSEHIRHLVTSVPYWETDTEIFTHASLESDVSMHNQTSDFLRWKHIGGSELPHVSGKRVICGHTAQDDGYPLVFDGWVCIATYPHGGQWLTCLDVATNQVVQANQQGETREYPLSKLQ